MNRAFGVLVLLFLAGALAGCGVGGGASVAPSPTPAQVAAQVTQPPPTPTPAPAPAPPTAPPAIDDDGPAPAAPADVDVDVDRPGLSASAPVDDDDGPLAGDLLAAPAAGQAPARPAPPPDPGTGQSVIVPDPGTLESPLFGDDPNELQVALTFDAGADTGYAADILDLLAAEGIKASFGMTGQWAEAEKNQDLVRRMVNEGHMLFNHTYSHDSLTGVSTGNAPQTAEEVALELERTEIIVLELTGYRMKPYFRTPYADYDQASLGYLADNGYYLTIWWTCDTYGWKGWTADQINDYCTVNLKNHEIILLHVGADAAGDYASLPAMIASFREQGYAFVTVEEMVQPD